MNEYNRYLLLASVSLNEICQANEMFTVNDLYAEIVRQDIDSSIDLRSLATVILHGVKSNWCIDTGEKVQSIYGHGVRISVYQSLIYNGSIQPNKLF